MRFHWCECVRACNTHQRKKTQMKTWMSGERHEITNTCNDLSFHWRKQKKNGADIMRMNRNHVYKNHGENSKKNLRCSNNRCVNKEQSNEIRRALIDQKKTIHIKESRLEDNFHSAMTKKFNADVRETRLNA
jgi:hypothetical protein